MVVPPRVFDSEASTKAASPTTVRQARQPFGGSLGNVHGPMTLPVFPPWNNLLIKIQHLRAATAIHFDSIISVAKLPEASRMLTP